MDETTQSRTSDAAATRKRRSSILKSQRAARTPFSELEFHVATPTDTTKSRRVSFSRRTGVAEFATNEATTTWKNFYEEHNKSLESSGNDSSANGSKHHLGHIGKRIFDQQFEEVDAVDFMGSLNPGYNINSSISNINFPQLTSIECTNDIKLTAPQTNFELSAFTNNHSKLFNNDITVPGTGEISERIDVNFSAVQEIRDKDDLDEIQKDLENQGNVICHGPFRDRQNLSEYIEIDLNSTHAVLRNDESDMSITDTIHSPKVQEVSKSISIEKIVKKDWETDKENIAVNPYVTPKESVNFAINDEPDKVLVFDGKRLTIQSEPVSSKPISRQTITPVQIESPKAAQRKTIVLNVNDDLPNFINDPTNASGYLSVAHLKKYSELDSSMSITNPITKINETQRQKTVLYDDDIGDISLTQAISSNIVQEKRKTIVFEDGTSNISITQAMPTNIIDKIEKRRTILYDNDTGNISITKALPTNEVKNTVVYENEDRNITMTQALPTNIITEQVLNKRKTIVYEDDGCNLSITQAVPNIVISVKLPGKSCTPEDGEGNMSVTQAIPSNIIEKNLQERRRTVILDRDACNISFTQAVPSSLIYTHNLDTHIHVVDLKPTNIPSDNEINRRRTVVFEDNTGNLSITEAVSSDIISNLKPQANKRKTIVFNDDEADISMTQAVPMNKLISFTNEEKNKVFSDTNKRNTIVVNNEEAEMVVNQAIDHIISGFENTVSKDTLTNECTEKRRTIVFDNENADISMTQVVDVKQIIPEAMNLITDTTLQRNVIKDKVCDQADVSMSEVVSLTQEQTKNTYTGKCTIFENDVFIVHEDSTHCLAPKKSNINEILDISISENVNKRTQDSVMVEEFHKTTCDRVAKENETDKPVEDAAPISKPIPHNLSQIQDEILENSLKQYYKNAKNELLDHTANVSQVLVYQMSQSSHLVQKGIEKQDSIIQPPMPVLSDEGKTPVNTKIDDLKDDKETVVTATKFNDDVVDKNIDDKDYSSLMEIEAKPSLFKENDNLQQNYSVSSPQEVKVTKVLSEQSFKANEPDPMSDSPPKPEVKAKESILNDLLDMSTSSLEGTATDRTKSVSVKSDNKEEIMTQTQIDSYIERSIQVSKQNSVESDNKEKIETYIEETVQVSKQDSVISENTDEVMKESSNDTLFYITKDSDEEVTKELPQIETVSHLPLEYKEESPLVDKLQKKLALLKNVFSGGKHKNKNKQEDSKSDAKEKSVTKNITKCNKNFKLANDTNELLDMLSDLTDIRPSQTLEPNLEVDEEKPEPLLIKGHLALENKSEKEAEPRRINFVPHRRSIVLSREDILNNISMAGAALQKSRLELDESYSMDETTKESPDINTSTKKTVRLSTEVVKTLQFDEDSVSEANDSNIQVSPLKKTAFGETSYMTDRANVIPSYMKDVSDGIKELMDDLVKPMVDNVPFDSSGTVERIHKKSASTCSMQVQANLITSSQIDIDIDAELDSNSDSINDLPKTSSAEIIKDAIRRSMVQSLKSPMKSVTIMVPESEKSMDTLENSSPNRVIVFDHNNPLNNILLPPPEHGDIHKYNPVNSTDTMSALDQCHSSEVVSTQMNVENLTNYPRLPNNLDTESTLSNVSKSVSTDRSENTQSELKDTEVNTLIAMKGNKELLEASSSLTLVDDTMHDITEEPKNTRSPVKLLYKLEGGELPEKDTDLTSNEALITKTKPKKRIYSPTKVDKHKFCTISSLDLTPKPLSKMQKVTDKSFKQEKNDSPTKLKADKDENKFEIKRIPSPTKHIPSPTKQNPSPTKQTPPAKHISPSTKRIPYTTKQELKRLPSPMKQNKGKGDRYPNITVQQVKTEFKINNEQETLKQLLKEAPNTEISSLDHKSVSISNSDTESLDIVSSCTSSKNLGRNDQSIVRSRDDQSIVTSSGEHRLSDDCSGMEWQENDEYTRNKMSDCDSSVNIVAKIDMLPFMGSQECEWESSIGDTWSFRLLHSCLRLTVRLQHRHDNATRTCVRADTPVLHALIDTLHTEKKNPIAVLCVRFAGEAMKFELSRGCSVAGSVLALVRRCAAIARVATRWARIMHETRARLAYSLTEDGILAVKVANIPLRSVWEVRLKLELVVSENGGAAYPRATPLAATPVLAERHVTSHELRHLVRDLPHDWGHAPRTIWRIFKYLKHKKREDEFLELKY